MKFYQQNSNEQTICKPPSQSQYLLTRFILKETMSNIVCAYCHIKGHHIKFCAELVEKNRRRQEYAAKHSRQVSVQVNMVIKPQEIVKSIQSKNAFSNLYSSSDDDDEDGEIFEDDRSNSMKIRRLSAALSFESESESESESKQTNKWCRSGIKGVVIPIKTAIKTTPDYSDDDESVEVNPSLLKTLAELRLYVSQFDGMSWADVEYLSDCE